MNQDASSIWEAVLHDMKSNASPASFLTLFRYTALESLTDKTATIAAPSTMVIDMLQKRFTDAISASLENHAGRKLELLFIPKSVVGTKKNGESGPLFEEQKLQAPSSIGHLPRVRADFTFGNFAVSSSNQLAFVSASAVAQKPGQAYNPLFIYGPVGVGKTHLMQAIANDVYAKNPGHKIIYITSEEFTNEVVEAIRNNDTARMKKKFRTSALLIIDDIQFIEGKEKVQEELFHTFNILIDHGSQIVLSSDRPPQEIKRLEKRLSSRFAGGLAVDIGAPDFELKTAILLIKAQKYNIDLSIDVAKVIAEKAEDTRSLEGLLLRLITQAETSGETISEELAEKSFGAMRDEPKVRLHTDDVIDSVCDYYQIKSTQLKGPKRDASLVRARHIAMYLLKTELHLTYAEIGNVLGGRDHTTVMHGVEKIGQMRQSTSYVSEDIAGITTKIHG